MSASRWETPSQADTSCLCLSAQQERTGQGAHDGADEKHHAVVASQSRIADGQTAVKRELEHDDQSRAQNEANPCAELAPGVKALEKDVFGIAKAVEPITELTVTDSIHKPQTNYKIESVTIDGTDLDSFVFAVDGSKEVKAVATKYQGLFYQKTGDYLEIVNISIEDICQASKFYFGDKINDYEAQGEWIW